MKKFLLTLVIVVVLAVLFKLGQTFVDPIFSSENSRNAPEQALTLATVRAKIGEGAIFLMKPDFYPKTFAELGAERVQETNELFEYVALEAVSARKCDRLWQIELRPRLHISQTIRLSIQLGPPQPPDLRYVSKPCPPPGSI